jgi:N-acetylglucosamine-6-sulfatase
MGVGVGRSSRRRRLGIGLAPVVVAAALASWFLLGTSSVPTAKAQTQTRPNIVLILTDDQRFDSLHVMPEVQRLASRGMLLRRAIDSNPLCCPSRATILTGRYSHTTGVYTNGGMNGGWTAFKPWESETIATALDAAGYRTALVGKYLNGYAGADLYVPPGWDRWSAVRRIERRLLRLSTLR